LNFLCFLALPLILSSTIVGKTALAGRNLGLPLALVYNGPGACPESCAWLAARAAHRAGYSVHYVNEKTLTAESFRDASLWVMPGGDAYAAAGALSAEQKALVHDFVKNGGHYLGFCAGAFIIDRFVDDASTIPGFDLWGSDQYESEPDHNPRILSVNWKGTQRWLYHEGGGYFKLNPADPHLASYSITAKYSDGRIAALQFELGRGRVAVTGLHPEASEDWKKSNHLVDPDGDDQSVVSDMIGYLEGRP
jgi:glutamine amidotransferase-like uncharacterized protein